MEIVIFGKGQLAIDICTYLHGLGFNLRVIPVNPEPNWAPSLRDFCLHMGITTFTWEKFRQAESRYPLGLSVFYDKIFKSPDIAKFDKLLNIHNAPLPKYRGVNPINWALKNEEKNHGVTIHQINESIDEGDIYGQRLFPIDPETDEVEDVYERCLSAGLELFKYVFENLQSIIPSIQNEMEASYYSKVDFERLAERKDFRRKGLIG